jgi:hypothetical protein
MASVKTQQRVTLVNNSPYFETAKDNVDTGDDRQRKAQAGLLCLGRDKAGQQTLFVFSTLESGRSQTQDLIVILMQVGMKATCYLVNSC